ncbi:hypothetical protein D9M68_818390 [compost metagenome]
MPQCLAQLHVHACGGLVEHDHRRFVHQRLRHQHTALHATGKLAHVGASLIGQAQAREQLVDPGVVVADAEIPRLETQRFTHVKKGIKHQFLRHHTERTARSLVVGLNIVSFHQHAPTGGAGQPGEDADEGGFPSSVGAQQPEKFTGLDIE